MPKKNKNYLLERQVENQGKSIKQLLGEIEDLKVKTTRYMEQAHKYRAELSDLRTVNDSLEESIGQKNEQLTQLFSANKSISEKNYELLNEVKYYRLSIDNLRLEVSELKKPWYKKIFRRHC